MITIGSVKEDLNTEKRIAITPDTVKKFNSLGFSINLENKYAEHLGISDEEFKKNGANICTIKKEVFQKSDIILKVASLSEDDANFIKNKSIFIGQFDPIINKNIISKSATKDVKIFMYEEDKKINIKSLK